ncbi:lipase chaperone [Plesiocystis pacifica SIR-1]|uniref:Lipase helper protein n=1 Tax=Plesiocystis pacifica SIR-1 TaxID=391625 RepID=A6GAC0_9BACT|nr:lipase secretion chaperone [Plesiocystis pacifica]EDM77222.1 lipase chaperone [Plesiocystis pacifica SIR-1]
MTAPRDPKHSRLFSIVALSVAALAGLLGGCELEPDARLDAAEAPRSLDGTELDGAFSYDRDGHFVLDEGAVQAFDYFLTADGELSPAEIDAWVQQSLRAEIRSEARRGEIMDAWYAYLVYRAEAAEAAAGQAPPSAGAPAPAEPDALEATLAAALDRFEAEVGPGPFVTHERAQLHRAVAVRAAYALDDAAERDAELARIDQAEAERFAHSRAGRYLAARDSVQGLIDAGADDATVQAARAEHFDAIEPGAAERLAALDAKRAAWNAKLASFRTERQSLRDSWVASPAGLDEAVAELELERFTAAERRRVHALERLDDGAGL